MKSRSEVSDNIGRLEKLREESMTGVQTLIVDAHSCLCALPLTRVIEIMRPLPIESIAGAPPFVSGISIIRSNPTPVVDLARLLGTENGESTRFVTLRLGGRQIALAVETVLGVHELDAATMHALPPLLQRAAEDIIETIGTLDSQMLLVLREGWELPDEVWQAVALSYPPIPRDGAVPDRLREGHQ